MVGRSRVALPLALLCASCVQFQWTHESTYATVEATRVATLKPGESDLGTCLAVLGAPLYVWEYRGDGVALAFGAQRGRNLGVGVSVPVTDQNSVSFDYGEADAQTRGWVLFFDSDWMLAAVREGRLVDLAQGFQRQPPAPVDD